jgi:signal transduction histidine kinase
MKITSSELTGWQPSQLGCPLNRFKGAPRYDLYPEEGFLYHQDDLEVISTGKPKLGIVERYQAGSGEKRWIRTDKIPYRDEGGTVIGVIVFSVDITDQKRAEEALQSMNETLEEQVKDRTAALLHKQEELRYLAFQLSRTEERERKTLAADLHDNLAQLLALSKMKVEVVQQN